MMKKRKQRGRSKATLDLIATCSEIIEQVQPISVRGVCYRLLVAGLIASMAVKNTQKISRLLVQLREGGVIPWEWIVDETRSTEREPHWFDLKEYASAISRSYRRDFWEYQEERVVMISEKSTVAGLLRPVLEEYGVPFMSFHGYTSATTAYELAREIQDDEREHVFGSPCATTGALIRATPRQCSMPMSCRRCAKRHPSSYVRSLTLSATSAAEG